MNKELSVQRVKYVEPKSVDLQLSKETSRIRITADEAMYKELLGKGWSPLYSPEVGRRINVVADVWMVYKATVPAAALDKAKEL